MIRSTLTKTLSCWKLPLGMVAFLFFLSSGIANAGTMTVTANIGTSGSITVQKSSCGSASTCSTAGTCVATSGWGPYTLTSVTKSQGGMNDNNGYIFNISAGTGYGISAVSVQVSGGANQIQTPVYAHTDRSSSLYHDTGYFCFFVPNGSSSLTINVSLQPRYSLTPGVSTVLSASNGTVSPSGVTYWLAGESTTVAATAATHNAVQSAAVVIGTTTDTQSFPSYPDSANIIVTNIQANTTVTASFVTIYTITSSTEGLGTGNIDPTPTARVPANGSKTFTVTAASGSKIYDVIVNGTSLGHQSSPYTYTFTGVNSDSNNIVASFNIPAVNMNNYCSTPAFLTAPLKPNVLLMLDNSASMYDLANTNANATTYCYDNSYVDGGGYYGYFDRGQAYSFNFTSQDFELGSTTIPGSCTYSTAYLCVTTQGGAANGTVTSFWAKGGFLNWLSASKFDQMKKALTGGKYDMTSHLLISESRGCVGRRFVKDIPTADWVTKPSGGNLTFGVRGPNSYDVDYVTKSTQGGKTRIEIFPGTYDAVHCNLAVSDWTDPASQGAIQSGGTSSNTSLCLGSSGSLKSNAYNHVIHLCYRSLTGNSNAGELQPLEGDCTSIYSTYYQNNPANITNETAGDAVCASALTHSLTTNGETGYIGRCWTGGTWDPALNSGAGGWVGGIAPTWNDTCVQAQVQDYCAGAHAFDVTDPSDSAMITGTTLITPSFIIDAGLSALGSPIATMLAQVSQNPPPTGLIQRFADGIEFGTIQYNYNGVGTAGGSGGTTTECGGTSSIPCAMACKVTSTAQWENPIKECYRTEDCPSGDTCLAIDKLDGGIVVSPIGTPLGSHATPVIVGTATAPVPTLINNIDLLQATSWTPLAETFYDAIGYLSHRHGSDAMQLNTTDFDLINDALDPSTYTCRDNYVVIMSDGGSTADQNSSVNSLAGVYGTSAGLCSGGYMGSKNLDDLAGLAFTKNIKTFSLTDSSVAAIQNNKNEKITTYVLNTGHPATGTDECASGGLLLDQTAAKGGTVSSMLSNNATAFETNLANVFSDVATRVTSGTAASILSNSEGSGANLLQAIFFPKKTFDGLNTSATWIGELQDFWYYIDPFIGNSTVREDTSAVAGADLTMNLRSDYVSQFIFNPATAQTEVRLLVDTNGDGLGDSNPTNTDTRYYHHASTDPVEAAYVYVTADNVRSLWRAGRQLWLMNPDTRNIYTQLTGALVNFTAAALDTHANSTGILGLLQSSSETEANGIINYVRGSDADTTLRNRTLSIHGQNTNYPTLLDTASVWKLGDIISSTPRVQSSNRLNNYNMGAPAGYSDYSYTVFSSTPEYKNRGMAYVGANDGMLHAFKAGKLIVAANGDQKATLTAGTGGTLGKEEWAFIPKNALPYLTYLTDPSYPHINYVDGTATLADVSINTCGSGISYWNCPKDYTSGANWKSILVGGMGLGGASKNYNTSGVPNSVTSPVNNNGYSSYFGLDITNQTFDATTGVRSSSNAPSLLWEFSHPELGYATSGPAIVRIAATTGGVRDNTKNGRWFAVFGSGPTGPIDNSATASCQFKGKSDQNLKLFVVDLQATTSWTLNTNYWIIDSGIPYAFAGSISGGVIDADRWNPMASGNYQDDAVYLGYVRNTSSSGTGTWTDGGVLRLLTKEDINPANWTVAKVIDGVGAVTSNIAKLQDRKNHNLWLYFGSGRYFYNGDDMDTARMIYGIKEPCYTQTDAIRKDCSASDELNNSLLTNQTTSPSASLALLGGNGWYINLAAKDDTAKLGAERSVTDPVAMINGAVFFTTYKPTTDPCKFGGRSRMWAVTYDTGGQVPARTLKGKALVQISTGEFKEIDLSTAFTAMGYRAMGSEMTGKPPGDPPPIVTSGNNKPVKKILHIEEH